jgi:hypothetical protein
VSFRGITESGGVAWEADTTAEAGAECSAAQAPPTAAPTAVATSAPTAAPLGLPTQRAECAGAELRLISATPPPGTEVTDAATSVEAVLEYALPSSLLGDGSALLLVNWTSNARNESGSLPVAWSASRPMTAGGGL